MFGIVLNSKNVDTKVETLVIHKDISWSLIEHLAVQRISKFLEKCTPADTPLILVVVS